MAKYFTYNNQSISVGDTVRVGLLVAEGADKTREQMFEGVIIAVDNRQAGKAFTIRKISAGVGVERIIPVNSPAIGSITMVTKGDVRRAKLNFMRERTGKQAMKVKKKLLGATPATS